MKKLSFAMVALLCLVGCAAQPQKTPDGIGELRNDTGRVNESAAGVVSAIDTIIEWAGRQASIDPTSLIPQMAIVRGGAVRVQENAAPIEQHINQLQGEYGKAIGRAESAEAIVKDQSTWWMGPRFWWVWQKVLAIGAVVLLTGGAAALYFGQLGPFMAWLGKQIILALPAMNIFGMIHDRINAKREAAAKLSAIAGAPIVNPTAKQEKAAEAIPAEPVIPINSG